MGQRLEFKEEQRLWPQHCDPEWPVLQNVRAEPPGFHHPRQQQRIGPRAKPRQYSRYGAAGGPIAPEETTEKRRCELGDSCKRNESNCR